jgi:hypothetical protein
MTHTEHPAAIRPDIRTETRVPLVCPECREPARAVPPREWPLAGFAPRPRHSHRDGTPLCPVVGLDGYTPADPIGAAACPAPAVTGPVDTTSAGATTTRPGMTAATRRGTGYRAAGTEPLD